MAGDSATKPIRQLAKILVVEGEATARTSLSELLRDEGYPVIEAAESGAAISVLTRQSDIKGVITDLEVPSWSAIIKHARAEIPESFILGMVRYGAILNALEAKRLGAHGYLIKPLSFNEVNQWIQRALTGRTEIKR